MVLVVQRAASEGIGAARQRELVRAWGDRRSSDAAPHEPLLAARAKEVEPSIRDSLARATHW